MPTKIASPAELVQRFWSYVDKGPVCWTWKAGRFARGYGQFRVGTRKVRAHRFVYEIEAGPIPEGMFVCHHCDNPLCVRPSHLFLGTAADNAADRDRKGRYRHPGPAAASRPGEKNPAAKLTLHAVKLVRGLSRQGYSNRRLAKIFNMGASQIGNIVRGDSWKEAANE